MKGQFRINGSGFQSITMIDVTREAIIEKSVLEFGDEDPCIIYETHCRMKIAFHLMERIKGSHPELIGREVKIRELSPEIREVLCYGDNETIEFK